MLPAPFNKARIAVAAAKILIMAFDEFQSGQSMIWRALIHKKTVAPLASDRKPRKNVRPVTQPITGTNMYLLKSKTHLLVR